jgi:exportin-2 (importin alpha re-exporter)
MNFKQQAEAFSVCVRALLQASLCADAGTRTKAEKELLALKQTGGSLLFTLKFIEIEIQPASAPIRMAAAVLLKNLVKQEWNAPGREAERDAFKANVVGVLCTCPKPVQRQLTAAIGLIGDEDFPSAWQSLLPELARRLSEGFSSAVTIAVLAVCEQLCQRFRQEPKSDAVMQHLPYVIEHLHQPLLQLFLATSTMVAKCPQDQQALLPDLLQAQQLAFQILLSIVHFQLSPPITQQLSSWLGGFHCYLEYQPPSTGGQQTVQEEVRGHLQQLQVVVVEGVALFVQRYPQAVLQFLPPLLQVCSLGGLWRVSKHRVYSYFQSPHSP